VEIVNEKNIATQYLEDPGPYAKFGQDHSVDKNMPPNVIYVDEYRVTGPGACSEDVAPRAPCPRPHPAVISTPEVSTRGRWASISRGVFQPVTPRRIQRERVVAQICRPMRSASAHAGRRAIHTRT
jgi:hypothetical protein